MKYLLILNFVFTSCFTFSQENKNYLYLENTVSGKVKRLKLNNTSYMSIIIDSTDGSTEGYLSYTSRFADASSFGQEEVIFNFDEYSSYNDIYDGDNNYYTESYMNLQNDSTVRLAYTDLNRDFNFSITHQTKFRGFMYNLGLGILSLSVFNAAIVSPLIGMNNGSFSGYNWNRFWKYELISGISFTASIPLIIGFLQRDFYTQTQSSSYPIWKVVDGK